MTEPSEHFPEDLQLARQARLTAEAFAQLYHRYVSRVYRYHLVHTGNVKDAEDLTSQTFLAALEGIRTYRGSGSFAAWLMGIAAKKRALYFREAKPEIWLEAASNLPNSDLSTDQTATLRLQLDHVSHSLKQISPERAEAIVLCLFSGMTCAEAAKVLRKSEAAVKMLVSRGLHDLREHTSLALEVES
jgi:RNA polymerase sigma-70 factor (ECF subfamily)